jgi:hypothetical protein
MGGDVMKLTLIPPIRVTEQETRTGKRKWLIEDAEGRTLGTWEDAVSSFLASAESPVEVEVRVSEVNGRTYRNVVSIPGRIERRARARGGMTDRQAALLASAILHAKDAHDLGAVLSTASLLLDQWFGGGEPSSREGSVSSEPSSRGGSVVASATYAPAPPGHSDLEELLSDAFPGRPQLAKRWLSYELERRQAASFDDLPPKDQSEIAQALAQIAAGRAS